MIQRKQTLFLLAAFILTCVCVYLQMGHHIFQSALLVICQALSAVLSLVTIFMYMKRKLQAAMCLVNMALLVIWYILLAVLPENTGGMMVLEWTVALPAVCILLLFMAHRGILADEKLVRSLDRIR